MNLDCQNVKQIHRQRRSAAAMYSWLCDLIAESLLERGFRPAYPQDDLMPPTKDQEPVRDIFRTFNGHFIHSTCPGAVFTFIWVEVSENFVTGSGLWILKEDRGCISIDRLKKVQPSEKPYLKRQIVDRLILPCLYSCQQTVHGFPKEGLVALPPEIIKRILSYLPVSSLCSLATVHSVFHSASHDWTLWKGLYRRDFPMNRLSPSLQSENCKPTIWRELYKTEYLANRANSSSHPALSPLMSASRRFVKFRDFHNCVYDVNQRLVCG